MRKVGFLIAVFFNILSLISFAYEGEEKVVKQGEDLRRLISEETMDKVYNYLDRAGIDIDKMGEIPYFYKRWEDDRFLLEIEGDFKDLRVKSREFIEDVFHIEGSTYNVRYTPDSNEITLVYDDNRVYLASSLERAYKGIENIDRLKKEFKSYFSRSNPYTHREIRYEMRETIYGNSFLKAAETVEGVEREKLFFNTFSIDEEIEIEDGIGRARVILDYPELSKKLMDSISEIDLDPKRIEKLLYGRVEGAFALEEGIALKSREPLERSTVVELYNEGVLKRIGLETGREEGLFFLKLPFFQSKKYIFEEGNWIFISENLEYIKGLRVASEIERDKFLGRLKALLEFKEESSGYTGYKEGVQQLLP